MKRNILLTSFLVLGLFMAAPSFANASTGVSVNTGKIVLDNSIMPGGQYDLPNIEVKNIGDESSDYGMSVEYNEVQSQMKPEATWFTFNPSTFHLEPGESKIVKVSVSVPMSALAGDYFAYVEAHSEQIDGVSSLSSVSGAAATKVYLSVTPSNFFAASYYRLLSFVHNNPWSYAVLWIIAIIIILAIWKRLHHIAKGGLTNKQQ